MRISSSAALCIAASLALSSCSSQSNRSRLTGTITLDGEPLDKYQIALIPAEGPKNAVAGTLTKADGGYEIRDVLPGRYKVVISEFKGPFPGGAPAAPPRSTSRSAPLPPNYSDRDKTDLSIELQSGRQTQDFALKSRS